MTEEQLAEQKAKRFWVALVVLLLGLQVVIGVVAINLATGDSSAAVIPNYHNEALNWDATHKQRTALTRLGWNLTLVPSDVVDGQGGRVIRVEVSDEHDVGVDDLQISVDAYHHARGRDVAKFTMDPLNGGTYQAIAPMRQSGLWQLEIVFRHQDERIVVVRTIDV